MSTDDQSMMRLYCHPASSASMRVMLYLALRGVPAHVVRQVHTGLETDHRGIMVFTLPRSEPEFDRLGTSDLSALNREGRIPILLFADGRMLTQSGAMTDFFEETLDVGTPPAYPSDPWARAQARRLMSIIASDTQPYQNIPFIIQAMSEWGMVTATPTEHPLRLHFIRREFGAIDAILPQCAGTFAVGVQPSPADRFLVPQIRNALLAGIDLESEFPRLAAVWRNAIALPRFARVIAEAGGVVQPLAYDEQTFEVHATNLPPRD
ncbi:MAG: hypothetical protein AAF493_09585 [Pseudomonadota bacterium]